MRGRRTGRRSGIAPFVNVTVRAASSGADETFVADLGRRTAAASVSSLRPAPEGLVENALERLLETVAAQSHRALIAEYGGERAGFVLLLDRLPDDVTSIPQGFVAYMAVEPSLRSRGIGTALLAAAEDEARRCGLPYIALMVTEENAAARALYERAGYATERRLLCKAL